MFGTLLGRYEMAFESNDRKRLEDVTYFTYGDAQKAGVQTAVQSVGSHFASEIEFGEPFHGVLLDFFPVSRDGG